MARKEWSIVDAARKRLLASAAAREIPIYRIEYVASFGDWSKGMGVFIFFPLESDLHRHKASGATAVLEAEFRRVLTDLEYPFDKFPDVIFEFDSDENVQKNYEGSYFYRLR